jgi:NAD(P)-dependent dehydrogenase (short-subunit alcohol dehydrogenase family)
MTLNACRVVVVGGSSGIGRGVAEALVERNADVVLVGRSREKLENTSGALGGPPHVRIIAADASREEDVARMFVEVGSFDHLVVTGGVGTSTPIASMNLNEARAIIENKLIAAVALAKHSCGKLRVGGSITFSSGISKDRPTPGGSVVAAVAASLGGLARALALEMGPTRVNVVSPGWVDTPVWDSLAGEGKTAIWEQMAHRLPVGRIGTPADLALAYVFLMESEFTTGTTLHVDGGHALV